jgi:hypothetical protein
MKVSIVAALLIAFTSIVAQAGDVTEAEGNLRAMQAEYNVPMSKAEPMQEYVVSIYRHGEPVQSVKLRVAPNLPGIAESRSTVSYASQCSKIVAPDGTTVVELIPSTLSLGLTATGTIDMKTQGQPLKLDVTYASLIKMQTMENDGCLIELPSSSNAVAKFAVVIPSGGHVERDVGDYQVVVKHG